ncbi:MAG TPA: DUF2970 domain-containing protein [Paralcaligenes sp.]
MRSFLKTLKAVAWGFFGVRKNKDHAQDTQTIDPFHLIIAGLLAGAVLVIGLLLIIRWVVPGLS